MKKVNLGQEREFKDGMEVVEDIKCDALNYYAFLELKASKSVKGIEIKQAYIRLSREYHPDKGKTSDGEKFHKINDAYEVLSKYRNIYDYHLLTEPSSRQDVPEFECSGCHFKSDHLFKKHEFKNGSELNFCTYFCLPDCANTSEGQLGCESNFGKCHKKIIKSKQYGNVCSESCLNKLKDGEEWLKRWQTCIKCGKPWKSGEEYHTTSEGMVCLACSGEKGEGQSWKCSWCEGGLCEKNRRGSFTVYIHPKDSSKEFCSKKCRQEWEKSLGLEGNEGSEKKDFATNKLKTLLGWNLLSEEEQENFIEQINNSESEQFENILHQAKKLIKEKRALNTQKRASKNNNSGENNTSDHETDSGYDSNQSHESESEELSNLFSLTQSQTQTEQKIEKLLKDSGISDQQLDLDQKELLQGIDWKEYLKKLDTPTKIKEFANQIEQAVLKLKLASKTTPKDQTPKNEWLLPVAILVVSLLALTSLVLIVRRKRQRRGF